MGHPEDADIWQLAEPAADKDRLGQRRVVVSGKDHNREPGLGEQPSGAIEDGRAELIVLKGVAGQQKNVGFATARAVASTECSAAVPSPPSTTARSWSTCRSEPWTSTISVSIGKL